MAKRIVKAFPNPYRRYAVAFAPASGKVASPALVRHHARQQAIYKAWSKSVPVGENSWADEIRDVSLHILARKSLEYHRMRAHFMRGDGWPNDKPSYDLWNLLSSISRKDEDNRHHCPDCNRMEYGPCWRDAWKAA